MTTADLAGALRTAMSRADPVWVDQPSHLRRRLEDVLAADARQYRSEIHQLVVAAEERVPARLRRDGWSTDVFTELTGMLVSRRGWTNDAASWAVITWATALDLVNEPFKLPLRPPTMASRSPATNAPPAPRGDQGSARRVGPGPTVLPTDMLSGPTSSGSSERPATSAPHNAPTPPTDLPRDDLTAHGSPPQSLHHGQPVHAVAAGAGSAPSAPAGGVVVLPTRGTRAAKRNATRLLGHDVDLAYEVRTGASPLWLLLATPIGLAAFVAPAISGFLLLAYILIMIIGSALWPTRLVAVRGDDIWLLKSKRSRQARPDAVLARTTRAQVRPRRAFLFRSVEIDGQQLWFLLTVGRKK